MTSEFTSSRMLIANRGEIAIRLARTAADLGLYTCAIHPEDDAASRHVHSTDEAVLLPGRGAAAYLDIDAVIEAAKRSGCDMVHPGYGFLSENAAFAARCQEEGILFIGPDAAALRELGDKARARDLARRLGVPVVDGADDVSTLESATAFFEAQPRGTAIMIKAVAGGGGRGIRVVRNAAELPAALESCRNEARSAFGDGALYVERLIERARHVEVQILGDGQGGVVHLWERECTLQRRNQKLLEIAPSPWIDRTMRDAMLQDACRIAAEVGYRGLATMEFLVDLNRGDYAFIEVNPRIQVEHTVTEELTGLDLVAAQIRVCAGDSLEELGLEQEAIPEPRCIAVQARINAEVMSPDGSARMASGRINAYETPGGPGVRVDGGGYRGLNLSPHYDSLLAKVIVRGKDWVQALTRLDRSLAEFRVDGVPTNLGFLRKILALQEVRSGAITTRFVDEHAATLVAAEDPPQQMGAGEAETLHGEVGGIPVPPGFEAVAAPMGGVLVRLLVAEGDAVAQGAPVAVLEAMKMEHVVSSKIAGYVRGLAPVDAVVAAGEALVVLEPADVAANTATREEAFDPDRIRPDLEEALKRRQMGFDAARPEAVKRRHAKGKRTARENIADLCDQGSFVEYGALAVAAQRSRHSEEHLRQISPADGLVAGLATINGSIFGSERARAAVMSYDYTVFAGTQGNIGHRKTDRLLRVAERSALPVVIYAEGGGGRPGDTDNRPGVNLANPTFWQLARMSGVAPMVGIVSGRCFAGNAAVLGVCDVVIATEDANIGMGGPAMIEGAGLGVYRPEEVGPVSVQAPNGVIDVLVADEAEATAAARKYLSYFQGSLEDWEAGDERMLRGAVPEDRKRAYDVRPLIEMVADKDSVLELRRQFGPALVTALIRIEGRPCGVMANVAAVNGGALDRDEADKAARFMQLCDAYDLPIISLVDTPGFMVGPDAETRANVRHFSRMFLVGASLNTPFLTVILRKAYGLGAMAMSGGSFHESSQMTLSWPSGEFGAMGLEGAARLGFRKELEAITDSQARDERYREIVAGMYEAGKAVNIAPYLSIDAVIDPAETRSLLAAGLAAVPRARLPKESKRPMVDAW
ncbi:carboxyl transferase domain-containing protein [Chelativorans sp. YIM 93263]|uniref:carboxyl transferase domain-containing protein n=1 Tax=Chelativorans sp. YIM 93263 TaxID=2906648 RepID=UPI0023784C14|nr:carboxyl transferase domain-containing protein [Chelativorans sp. YIM 93263]